MKNIVVCMECILLLHRVVDDDKGDGYEIEEVLCRLIDSFFFSSFFPISQQVSFMLFKIILSPPAFSDL